MTWEPILPVRMRRGSLTVMASQAQDEPWLCPEGTAARMRGLYLTDYGWKNRSEPWPKLPFLLHDVVTAVGTGRDPDDVLAEILAANAEPPIHPGVARYLKYALATYVETDAMLAEGTPGLRHTPAREALFDADTVKAFAIYLDDGAGLREVRRLRQVHTREPDDNTLAWAGVAAYTLVHGTRFYPGEDPPPTRIRILEVGLTLEDDVTVLLDGTPADASRLYNDHAEARLFRLATGITRRVGARCSNCYYIGGCDTLPRANGVLGMPNNGVCTRNVSASTLTAYRWCPAQHFLRDLAFLPRDRNVEVDTREQQRGTAVHQWLEVAHRRSVGCTAEDLPVPSAAAAAVDEGPLGLGPLTPENYALAWPLLRKHVATCALTYDHVDAPIEVETLRRYFDAEADVIVVAKPDLSFVAGGRPVWRETKTTGKPPPTNASDVVATSLAAALYLTLLADGVPSGDGQTPGVLEWEVLSTTDDEPHLYYLDTDDEQLVAIARHRVAETALAWHSDTIFPADPHPWKCDRCSVARWCPSAGASPLPGASMAPGVDPTDIEDVDNEPPPF